MLRMLAAIHDMASRGGVILDILSFSEFYLADEHVRIHLIDEFGAEKIREATTGPAFERLIITSNEDEDAGELRSDGIERGRDD
jgi:hypothetical protein